jgi:hypothetical protein
VSAVRARNGVPAKNPVIMRITGFCYFIALAKILAYYDTFTTLIKKVGSLSIVGVKNPFHEIEYNILFLYWLYSTRDVYIKDM